MIDITNKERIERIQLLLRELRDEATRGMSEHDIEEELGFRFDDGVAFYEFKTRLLPRGSTTLNNPKPQLRLIKGDID